MRTRGRGKKKEKFADVINGRPLTEFAAIKWTFSHSATWETARGRRRRFVNCETEMVNRRNSYSIFPTVCGRRISHRKWKETNQQTSMLPGPAVPGCCLVSFRFLWAILRPHPVQTSNFICLLFVWTVRYRDILVWTKSSSQLMR